MIAEISPHSVIAHCRSVLGLQPDEGATDELFLIALLRRTAGIRCPCSRITLRTAILESLAQLYNDHDDLSGRLDQLIEELIVAGDLLELADVTMGDTDATGNWVFAAPPAFVERKSGTMFLIGIVPDGGTFLSDTFRGRVIHYYNTRSIAPHVGENLAESLISEGLNELPESIWLKAPKIQSPGDLLEKTRQRLSTEPQCAPIPDLEIIDPATKPTYYRGRWTEPSNQTGTFVARRPQEFGAPFWCFAEIKDGTLIRVIDLPIGAFRWRACDAAWHLQMSIDHENGRPQRYRVSDMGGTHRFDFFSPLPLWSERRLMVLGRKCFGARSLFAYEIPATESGEEEEFLNANLWLAPLYDTK